MMITHSLDTSVSKGGQLQRPRSRKTSVVMGDGDMEEAMDPVVEAVETLCNPLRALKHRGR